MNKAFLLGLLALAGCATVQNLPLQAQGSFDALFTAAEQTGELLVQQGVLSKEVFQKDNQTAHDLLLKIRQGVATTEEFDEFYSTLAEMKGQK